LRARIEEEIVQFLQDDARVEYGFEATLSAAARLMVHEIAEQHGLEHASSGHGASRFVVIRKPLIQSETSEETQSEEVTSIRATGERGAPATGFFALAQDVDTADMPTACSAGQKVDSDDDDVDGHRRAADGGPTRSDDNFAESSVNALLREAALARESRARRASCEISSKNGTSASENVDKPVNSSTASIPNSGSYDSSRRLDSSYSRPAAEAARRRLHAKLSQASEARKPQGKQM
jgi:hypothetical protein